MAKDKHLARKLILIQRLTPVSSVQCQNVLGTSAGLPVSSVNSASYSAVGKLVLAALPPLLIAALSNACAASSSVSWSPSETVRPRAEIWFYQRKNYFSAGKMTLLTAICVFP